MLYLTGKEELDPIKFIKLFSKPKVELLPFWRAASSNFFLIFLGKAMNAIVEK